MTGKISVDLVAQGMATDWAAWIAAGGTGILAAAALWALRSLRDAKTTRHGQMILELSRRIDSPEITESLALHGEYDDTSILRLVETLYDDNAPAPTEADLQDFSILTAVPNLVETIGQLFLEKAVTLDLVNRMWGTTIARMWRAWGPAIEQLRRYERSPQSYEQFERLAAALAEKYPRGPN